MAKAKKIIGELFKYKKHLIALAFILSITAAVELGAMAGRAHGIADTKSYYTYQESLTSYMMNQAYGERVSEPQYYTNVYDRAKNATKNGAAFNKVANEIEHSKITIGK